MSCEVERRAREKEARLERQRSMEATRNKAALDRALAPPYRWALELQTNLREVFLLLLSHFRQYLDFRHYSKRALSQGKYS